MVPYKLALPVLAAAAVAAALVPAIALGGGGANPVAHAASTHTVTLREFRFHPRNLTIHRGDKVTWIWRDEVEHNVTFAHFHSRTQVHGSYTVRFTKSGIFNYHCTIHFEEGMSGKIIVH